MGTTTSKVKHGNQPSLSSEVKKVISSSPVLTCKLPVIMIYKVQRRVHRLERKKNKKIIPPSLCVRKRMESE